VAELGDPHPEARRTSCPSLVWAVLDPLTTHATNGFTFTEVDRQNPRRSTAAGAREPGVRRPRPAHTAMFGERFSCATASRWSRTSSADARECPLVDPQPDAGLSACELDALVIASTTHFDAPASRSPSPRHPALGRDALAPCHVGFGSQRSFWPSSVGVRERSTGEVAPRGWDPTEAPHKRTDPRVCLRLR
jgi:hypothetical protein